MADSSPPAGSPPPDPAAILRSRGFVVVLVFAAVRGIIVSLVGWAFLEVVHAMQTWVFTDLPSGLGLDPVPTWWGMPICTLAELTSEPTNLVLFSGQEALGPLVGDAGTLSVGTLILLLLFKGLAWGVSLGSFRGGPTFPAMFLGAAGGIAASHLPGLPASAAIPVAMGAMLVAFLRLPLSAIIIASLLCASAGPGAGPLVIIGVVVAHLSTLALEGALGTSDPPASTHSQPPGDTQPDPSVE